MAPKHIVPVYNACTCQLSNQRQHLVVSAQANARGCNPRTLLLQELEEAYDGFHRP